MSKDYCRDCKRDKHHGGDCNAKHDGKTCLFYDEDPRGEIGVLRNVKLCRPFGSEIPEKHSWFGVMVGGVEKTIQIVAVDTVEWDITKRGIRGIIIRCDIWFFTKENGPWPKAKPVLRRVK